MSQYRRSLCSLHVWGTTGLNKCTSYIQTLYKWQGTGPNFGSFKELDNQGSDNSTSFAFAYKTQLHMEVQYRFSQPKYHFHPKWEGTQFWMSPVLISILIIGFAAQTPSDAYGCHFHFHVTFFPAVFSGSNCWRRAKRTAEWWWRQKTRKDQKRERKRELVKNAFWVYPRSNPIPLPLLL